MIQKKKLLLEARLAGHCLLAPIYAMCEKETHTFNK